MRSSWPGFGRLTSTPARSAGSVARAAAAAPTRASMASVPSAPSIASMRPARDDDRLAHVEGPEAPHDVEAERNVLGSAGLRRDAPQRPLADEQLGRHRAGRHHVEALLLEEADDARQHAVVAARGDDAQDRRQIAKEAQIRPQGRKIGPAHRADDDELGAAGVA